MYLNLTQIAESFAVAEKVVEGWMRHEEMPHTLDHGRLFFDRAQVAHWAAARGLADKAGFLATATPAFATPWQLEALLRTGGIWRDVAAAEVPAVFQQIVQSLPGATASIRELLLRRLTHKEGLVFAPVGGGFALPHFCDRVSLGRESGAVALLLLKDALTVPEPQPDNVPITRLFFFVAPSPRAHLDVLGRLCRLLAHGPLREMIQNQAANDALLREVALADRQASADARERNKP